MIETKKNVAREKIKNGSYGNRVWVCRPNYLAQNGDEQLSVVCVCMCVCVCV